ncbi:hypothetical protein [Nostoc sp. ChiVER01]|uniref:hypothetical protein n=1 Tax=Nostoc sp. ChiVER01 TaxID=3075382 RepID=UPI002AD2455A|nr:hypothetical protein [Nostoc sp. ChiVER01]MDZ8226532.1 hypothetical protein [Nostoc sp. ChiVER01]
MAKVFMRSQEGGRVRHRAHLLYRSHSHQPPCDTPGGSSPLGDRSPKTDRQVFAPATALS